MSNCKVLGCACRRDKSLPVRIVELMEAVNNAKAESVAARGRYDQAKATLTVESAKLDAAKVYAVPGGVLMMDPFGRWVVRPLEVSCGA